ncbi:MAG: amidophosphoribosyltransferase [Bdellovibrionales bacterium]
METSSDLKTGELDAIGGSWREECAVFGTWGDPEASRIAFMGLYAQQHRGQESAGIVSLDKDGHHVIDRGMGLVGDVFKEENLNRLKGEAAVGHVRYSTTGRNLLNNAQPLTAQLFNGPLAIAHNGNLVNSGELRETLKKEGSIFQGTSDTECLLHLLARHPSDDLQTCLMDSAKKLDGAFSMVLLNKSALYVIRDPKGFRPLVLGKRKFDGGESYVVASETCAFDLIGAEFIRAIEPGEILKISDKGLESTFFAEKEEKLKHCVFEHVYFARPDSKVFGKHVYSVRKNMGRVLAKESEVKADVIVPVPDSGVPAALGFSEASGIPFEMGIIRNHYIGRTFIQPTQAIRNVGVKIKLNPQKLILEGKRVVLVDDSIVRGTTSKKIIDLVRQAGAKEVHFRVSAPPTTGPCYYGVDTPEKEQLIASSKSIKEIQEYIGADSLAYLSEDGLVSAVSEGESMQSWDYCSACFTGDYPTKVSK